MDIHKEWEQLNEQLFSNQSLKNEEIMNAITSESSSAIHKIKKGLRYKTYWCLLFIALFSILMFISRDNMEIVIAIGIVNLMYIVGYFFIARESKRMTAELAKEASILDSMKRNASLMQRAISFEKNLFGMGSPIIILCAMFYGRFSNGASFDELMHDPHFLKLTIVTCIVAVPLILILGSFLTKKAFGKDISQLNENINKLEGIEFLKTI